MKKTILTIVVAAFSHGLHAQTMNNVGTGYLGTPSALNGTNSQLQTAQDNQILFQGNNVFGSDASRNAIKVGIGVFNGSTPNGILDRLHLNDITSSPVYSRFTNNSTGIGNGFLTGIDGSGNAIVNQLGNLPMMFYTSGTERMRILGGGNIGINTSTPNNKLEIVGGTGASGLRLTNIPSTGSPGAQVLGTDINGDVILVAPATAGATAANGLNIASGNVELGGNLIHATNVNLNAYDLAFSDPGIGRFGIGGYVNSGNIGGPVSAMNGNNAKIVFDNGNNPTTQKIYAYAPTGYGSAIAGLDVEVKNVPNSGSTAIKTKTDADGSNTGIYAHINSSSSNTGNNYGFDSWVANGGNVRGINILSTQHTAYRSQSATSNSGVFSSAQGGYNATGAHGEAINGRVNFGGYFDAQQYGNYSDFISNTGVLGHASYGPDNIGVEGFANATQYASNVLQSVGVYGHAKWGADVIGVKGEAPPSNSEQKGTVNNLAGLFIGNINVTGTSYAAAFSTTYSDRSLKRNIKPLEKALEILNNLSPKTYNLSNENCKQLEYGNLKTQYGLIAQEVEEVFPDIVYKVSVPATRDEKGKVIHEGKELKAVSYEQLISVLIKGTQEQQTQIAEQQKQLQELNNQVKILSDKMEQASQNSGKTGLNNSSSTRVDLNDEHIVVLEQNVPNPFFESTVINYTLPLSYKTAKIVFTTNDGKLIKSVDLSTVENNSLTVYASSLSNGLYNYSLIVDDKIIDTKKMVKD